MATLAMPYPTSAAAFSERELTGSSVRAGESTTVFGAIGRPESQRFLVDVPGSLPFVLTVQCGGDVLPEWFPAAARAYATLTALEENWDSYGAKKIKFRAFEQAMSILFRAMPAGLPAPALVPLGDGGIQLEWHRRQQDFEITLPSDKPATFFYLNRETSEEREGPASNVCEISEMLRRLV